MKAAALLLRVYGAVLRSGSCAVRASLRSVDGAAGRTDDGCHGDCGNDPGQHVNVDCAVGWGQVKPLGRLPSVSRLWHCG